MREELREWFDQNGAVGIAGSASIPVATFDDIDAEYCLAFVRAVRDTVLSTVDADGLPSSRVIDVMLARDGALWLLVPRGKSAHAELMTNPNVAIVAQTTDFRMCRLRGVAERVPDAEQHTAIDAMFEANPGMSDLYTGDSRYLCEAFRIAKAEGEYYDLGQKPLVRRQFALGGEVRQKGMLITDRCTRCGSCVAACPQQCIAIPDEGPLVIDQSACLRCGACYEACPADAVLKRL